MKKKFSRLTDVFCDWNGTLLNDLAVVYGSVKRIFETFDLKAPPLAVYQNDISSDYMNTFYWKYGIPKTFTAEELNKIRMRYFEERWDKPRLFPRVIETVGGLKNLGAPTHIVTSEDTEIMRRRIDQFSLARDFDIICADAKDKRARLMSFNAQYDIALSSTVYVDDSADGIAAAKSLGMATIGILFGYQPEWRIRNAKPDFTAGNFREVGRILLSMANEEGMRSAS